MDLLQSTDKSITDIAFEVGYKDSNYFSTKFKRFTKKTPSQYR
jgi:AraC family L-rhamnose operon regulatory protein RhaS